MAATAPQEEGQPAFDENPFNPPLDRERHLRYWLRCLRTLLPRQYTSNDSIRMTLGFFIVSALDLLSPPASDAAAPPTTSEAARQSQKPAPDPNERRRLREWVLSCQHPNGGFCGSPTHTLPPCPPPDAGDDPSGANIAATSFALLLLTLLAEPDDAESAFRGVDRAATLDWLRQLQRLDGSFGEVLIDIPDIPGEGGQLKMRRTVEGGRDMRFCLIAALIRWILRGDIREGEAGWVEDIDIDALVRHIRLGQTYDGGLAESSMHESHAGYAYCALSALSLLDRPPSDSSSSHASTILRNSGIAVPSLVSFLVSRQLSYVDPAEDDEYDDNGTPENFPQPPSLSRLTLSDTDPPPPHVGFNGRANKIPDTCYTWWVCGTLSVLGHQCHHHNDASSKEGQNIITHAPARRFLMTKTQHAIGGFGKNPGQPPDIYHSYLGLAALSVLGEPGLKEFDASLCVSVETVRKLEAARRRMLRRAGLSSGEEGGSGNEKTKVSAGNLLAVGEMLAGRKAESLVTAGD